MEQEPEAKAKKWEVSAETWTPDHTRILLLTQRGVSLTEIARELKIHITTVSRVRNSTFFIQKLAGLQTKIIERVSEKRSISLATDRAMELIKKAAYAASKKVIQIGKTGTPEQRIQLDACKDIMDRAGMKPIEVLETRERVYSPEEVSHAKNMLIEAQEIVERLSNQRSPYILRDSSIVQKLPSSVTDKAHDVLPQPQPPDASSST